MTTLSPGKLWGVRRMADANGRFKMVAVDQRPPIKNPIKAARGTAEAPYADVAGFKLMLVRELQTFFFKNYCTYCIVCKVRILICSNLDARLPCCTYCAFSLWVDI